MNTNTELDNMRSFVVVVDFFNGYHGTGELVDYESPRLIRRRYGVEAADEISAIEAAKQIANSKLPVYDAVAVLQCQEDAQTTLSL